MKSTHKHMKLKGKRVEKGLTQPDMAEKLGITTRQYVNLENGQADFKEKYIIKILTDIFPDYTFEEVFMEDIFLNECS